MLEDPVPEIQMEALTQIGRSYFRAPEGTLAAIDLGGPVRTGETEERTLPGTLRDRILKKLQSEDTDIRAEAVLALVHCQDEETIEKIKGTLNDSNRTVRLAAVQALASMRNMHSIACLLEVAEADQDNLVRAKAISAVDWIGRGQRVEKEQPSPTRAVRTRGKGRGPHSHKVLDSLEAIEADAPSAYIRFLARQACKRFSA